MTDTATLVERCRRGDDLAWEQLVRTHQGRVYAVAYHYVRNVEDARDLAQEAFVRVYQKLDSYRGDAFVAWLIRMVRNLCIDHLRRRQARPPAADVPVEATAIADTGPGPEDVWLTDTRKRLVYDAMSGLAPQDREIILLKEIQGLKFREIADLLGLPIGTVKSRSNRARVELAQRVLQIDPTYGETTTGTTRHELRQ